MPVQYTPSASPTTSYPTVSTGSVSASDTVTPGQAGQATQSVVAEIQGTAEAIKAANDGLQAAQSSLTGVNTQIAQLQAQIASNKDGQPKGDQAAQLQALLGKQAGIVGSISSFAEQLKKMQQQMQYLTQTKLPQAEQQDANAADEQAKTQEEQQADQQANQAAAQQATEQASHATQGITQQLQALKISLQPYMKEENTPSTVSAYNQNFGPNSPYNDWSSGLTSD